MAKYQYKNKTGQELVVIGVGLVPPEGVIETDKEVNNPNLELLTEKTVTMVGIDPVTKPPKKGKEK